MVQQELVGITVELNHDECIELLQTHDVGRLGIVVDEQPMIFPVNYAMDGELIVFRNDPGTKLAHARLDRVAFEVDQIDPSYRSGWSVLVTGTAREFTGALDAISEREQHLSLFPWAGGVKDHWVRIVSPTMSGRRVQRVISSDRNP